jgi:hypothetical protein
LRFKDFDVVERSHPSLQNVLASELQRAVEGQVHSYAPSVMIRHAVLDMSLDFESFLIVRVADIS